MDIATKLTQIAEKETKNVELNNQLEQTLYGTETGGKSYYDLFWDTYQENGNRTRYTYGFCIGWTSELFKPKYDICPTNGSQMFQYCTINDDLGRLMKIAGKELDFSQNKSFVYMFDGSLLTSVPIINTTSATSLIYMFRNARSLATIEKLIIKDDGTTTFADAFTNASALKNITFEGVIGVNVNFRWSTLLTKDSIGSIVNALSDSTGATLTLSATAVNNAFQTADGLADGSTSQEWIELITPKSNKYDGLWEIALE